MGKLSFTRQARDDLLEIWRWIAQTNPITADRIFDMIEKACQPLREHPQMGRTRPDITPGARSLVIARWLILYRLLEGGVQIVRIVDGARDLNKLQLPTEKDDGTSGMGGALHEHSPLVRPS